MAGRFRIFLSSTMEDLANERALIEQRIGSYNFECVRAETMEPDGTGSWERIQQAIDSCNLFVLLSGDRYGWVPKKGPLADKKVSVTHGEYLYAKERNLPVLAFFKRPTEKTPVRTKDAIARKKFREEVASWEEGAFRAEFSLATDLAESVGNAITAFLSNQYLRGVALNEAMRPAPPRAKPVQAKPALPYDLVEAVKAGKVVMFAGAGISFAAGLPSASFFAETLVRAARDFEQEYAPSATGMGIASIAGDFERFAGRERLGVEIRRLLEAPGKPAATASHNGAVKLFGRIITTNYDGLFEEAAAAQGTGHASIVDRAVTTPLGDPFILKLHGSLTHPDTIVITEDDVDQFAFTHAQLLPEVTRLLDEYMPVVVGSSLRDPTIYRLFRNRQVARRKQTLGYAIVPESDPCIEGRHALLGLQTIAADLETLLADLEVSVTGASTRTARLP